MFRALDRASRDPEFAQQLTSFQASVVDATIQALTAEEVGRAFQDDTFHWKQTWVGQSEEHRTFYMGKRPMGVVKLKLTSGDVVNIEAMLFAPDKPEDLVARDPMQFAPGENVMTIQRKAQKALLASQSTERGPVDVGSEVDAVRLARKLNPFTLVKPGEKPVKN